MKNSEKFKEVFGFGADGSRIISVNATWWDCEFQNRKPQTNADRIRSMTDEELADWVWGVETAGRAYGPRGKNAWLDWLKEEAQSGNSI